MLPSFRKNALRNTSTVVGVAHRSSSLTEAISSGDSITGGTLVSVRTGSRVQPEYCTRTQVHSLQHSENPYLHAVCGKESMKVAEESDK